MDRLSKPAKSDPNTYWLRWNYALGMTLWGMVGLAVFAVITVISVRFELDDVTMGLVTTAAVVFGTYLIARHLVIHCVEFRPEALILKTYVNSRMIPFQDIAWIQMTPKWFWSSSFGPSHRTVTITLKDGKSLNVCSPVFRDGMEINQRLERVTKPLREVQIREVLSGEGEVKFRVPHDSKGLTIFGYFGVIFWPISIFTESIPETLMIATFTLGISAFLGFLGLEVFRMFTPWTCTIDRESLTLSGWHRKTVQISFREVSEIQLFSLADGERMKVRQSHDSRVITFSSSSPDYPVIRDLLVSLCRSAKVTGDVTASQLILPTFDMAYDKVQGSRALAAVSGVAESVSGAQSDTIRA